MIRSRLLGRISNGTLGFFTICWWMWKRRCALAFNNKPRPQNVATFIETRVEDLQCSWRNYGSPLGSRLRSVEYIGWDLPPQGYFKLNVGGSVKRHTGYAGAGGLLRDHLGNWVHGFTMNVGITFAFIAELQALYEGLKLARELGVFKLIVESDSK